MKKLRVHYIKKEVNVTFKPLPSTKEIKRITQEINGTIIKKLNSTIVFRSNTLSTKELIEYFYRQAMVEFAEPNYLYLQNQIGLPNDLLYREQYQWNLSAIQAEAGWDITKGGTETIRGLRGHTGNNLHSIIHPLFPPFPLACDKTLPD